MSADETKLPSPAKKAIDSGMGVPLIQKRPLAGPS